MNTTELSNGTDANVGSIPAENNDTEKLSSPAAEAQPALSSSENKTPPIVRPLAYITRIRNAFARIHSKFWRMFPSGVSEARSRRHWHELGSELVERLVLPILHPTFVLYLASGVIMLGMVPIALEWVRYQLAQHAWDAATSAGTTGKALPERPTFEPVLTALHTFYPALAWSSAMQINFAEAKNADRARKSLRALAFVLATVTLLLSILFNAARPLFTEDQSLRYGFIGVAMAVLLWWLANAREETFLEPHNADAAQGGDPELPTDEMVGDTKGFAI